MPVSSRVKLALALIHSQKHTPRLIFSKKTSNYQTPPTGLSRNDRPATLRQGTAVPCGAHVATIAPRLVLHIVQ